MTAPRAIPSLVSPDQEIDLDNCAREPIHIPGRIQPRGVLLAVRESDCVVQQASTNVAEVLGRPLDTIIGRPLADALGRSAATVVTHHVQMSPNLLARNPLLVHVDVRGTLVPMDAILHRSAVGPEIEDPDVPAAVLVIELEPADGPRPFSYANTYQLVRDAVAELNDSSTLEHLFDRAAVRIRELTGFDRVMVYRFDADYNGKVVAEAKREDLNSFFGLHYPATDIPVQARALYEKNWVRLISDVSYVPSDIVPTTDPATGAPLDLTHATLRSVSPIHLEYLGNMGVRASMSISLIRDGKLWGLIACHHYSGPHSPPFGVRVAAEFLGSSLSLRLVAQVEEERIETSRRVGGILAGLVAQSRRDEVPLATALTESDALLDLVPGDGVLVRSQGRTVTLGTVPDEATCTAILEWAQATGDEIAVTDNLSRSAPGAAGTADVAGALAIVLPDGQAVLWVRSEEARSVDWGGDPHNKAIALQEGDTVRLSPRKSFDRWREEVRGYSTPWSEDDLDSVAQLRSHLVEALYLRGRQDLRAAEMLQRSMLPASLPEVTGWTVTAQYEPSGGGQVGGDWYDALVLPAGRLAVIVGDVAGHGLPAAATMGQMRNSLRALLLRSQDPGAAITELNAVVRWSMPDQFATLVVALVDTATGDVEYASAGHLPPLLVADDSTSTWLGVLGSPPLGVGDAPARTGHVTVPAGGALVLFSDGLVERRREMLDVGVRRLQDAIVTAPDIDTAMQLARDPASVDDATLLVLRRDA